MHQPTHSPLSPHSLGLLPPTMGPMEAPEMRSPYYPYNRKSQEAETDTKSLNLI